MTDAAKAVEAPLHCPECWVDDPYQLTWKHVAGTVEHPTKADLLTGMRFASRLTAVEEPAKPKAWCEKCDAFTIIAVDQEGQHECAICRPAAPGDVRDGVELPEHEYIPSDYFFFGSKNLQSLRDDAPFRSRERQLRAALQQVAEITKDNANLKEMFELHKALITRCLGAGIRFEGDDEPLINERAEKLEAELSRLRGELKEREK